MFLASSAWVPTTMSMSPVSSAALVSRASLASTKRESWRSLTGKPAKRSEKVRKCWRASRVVGTTTATCCPDIAMTKAARSATSVLPKPTSPQIRRSIGRPLPRSSIVSAIAFFPGPRSLVGELGAELVVEALRRIGRGQRFQLARGGDADELRRHLAHPRLHLGLAGLPARAAETVERRVAFVRAVARQKLDVLDGQEQLAAVILQLQAVVRRTRGAMVLRPR